MPDLQLMELGVELERSSQIGGRDRLQLVCGGRIDALPEKLAQRCSLGAQEVLDLGEDSAGTIHR
jgi:hypothetical protein